MANLYQFQKFNERLFYWTIYPLMLQQNMNQMQFKLNNFLDNQNILPFSPNTQSAYKPIHNGQQPMVKVEGFIENAKQAQSKIKKTRTSKKKKAEEEYEPYQGTKKKQIKTQQNKNRNTLPNFLNQTLSFVQKKAKSGFITQKVFSKVCPNQQWTPDRYYLYMNRIRDRLDHYVNEQNLKLMFQIHDPLCQIFTKDEQQFYLRVTKILMRNFFFESANILILTSKRMHSSKRKDHLTAKRVVYDAIRQFLGEN